MTALIDIRARLEKTGWFCQPGAYVLVDGAFGSCGKGAVAALLGTLFYHEVGIVTTNAGPNSGHTGFVQVAYKGGAVQDGWQYHVGTDTELKKVLTQQIPVFGIVANHFGGRPANYLNGGAIIKPQTLLKEAEAYNVPVDRLWVHPNAAIIDHDHETDGAESTDKIASTNKGVGRALARKVMRESNVAMLRAQDFNSRVMLQPWNWDWSRDVTFCEVAQGFSLGINQQFFPYVTSRECSVGQALADAAIPFNKVKGVVMAVRTFPIRVGSTALGYSGDYYPDQKEITWNDIGRPPELTTVTKRIRRLFTWSDMQFVAALRVNQPSVIFISFLDYLSDVQRGSFIPHVIDLYTDTMGRRPDAVIGGYGPYPTDARLEA